MSFATTSPSAFGRSSVRSPNSRELEVEVFEERNPAIADSQVAEATLHLKGVG